jgi:hypothetical protein
MRFAVASEPGSTTAPNEDLAAVSGSTVVVLDGLTSRIESGCRHGTAWFVRQLMAGILGNLPVGAPDALRAALLRTADLHRVECDLTNPATPASAVAIVEFGPDAISYLLLSDVSVVLDGPRGPEVVVDQRIERSAVEERRRADSFRAGTPEKAAALIAMKKAEVAERNSAGGHWVASVDPAAVDHALTGTRPARAVDRAAVLTDGAARLVNPFAARDWRSALDLLESDGPGRLVQEVRSLERADPDGARWPRNKISDDATAVLVTRSASDARRDVAPLDEVG